MSKSNRFLTVLDKVRGCSENNNGRSFFEDFSIQHNAFIDFHRSREYNYPKELSYFCDGNVAESIIGNGRLWLNDVRKMNDSTEMTFAIEFLKSKIEQLKNNSNFDKNLAHVIEASFLDLTNSNNWNNTTTYNGKLILAMCFTQAKDDAGMWERYADNGKGVAIHFNLKKLSTAVSSAGIFAPNSSAFETGIVKVCYAGENCTCLSDFASEVLEAYQEISIQSEKDIIRTMLHANVLELLMAHKHNSFSSERELRVFSKVPSIKTWHGSDHIFGHGEGDFKSLHSEIFLPHQALNQSGDEFWKELISGVTLGPLSSGETKNKIQLALDSRGLGVGRLMNSDCPLQKTS